MEKTGYLLFISLVKWKKTGYLLFISQLYSEIAEKNPVPRVLQNFGCQLLGANLVRQVPAELGIIRGQSSPVPSPEEKRFQLRCLPKISRDILLKVFEDHRWTISQHNPLLFSYHFTCQNFVFCRFLRCYSRWAPIVYRLIGAALIGIFSIIPSYFEIEFLAIRT